MHICRDELIVLICQGTQFITGIVEEDYNTVLKLL